MVRSPARPGVSRPALRHWSLTAALAFRDAVLAAETCEELFTPQAPHIGLALAGACRCVAVGGTGRRVLVGAPAAALRTGPPASWARLEAPAGCWRGWQRPQLRGARCDARGLSPPCVPPAGVEIISNGSGSHHQLRKLNQARRHLACGTDAQPCCTAGAAPARAVGPLHTLSARQHYEGCRPASVSARRPSHLLPPSLSRAPSIQRLDLMLNGTAKSGGVYLYANQKVRGGEHLGVPWERRTHAQRRPCTLLCPHAPPLPRTRFPLHPAHHSPGLRRRAALLRRLRLRGGQRPPGGPGALLLCLLLVSSLV